MEFFAVQDILSTETTELADVVLPGAAFSEKSGSFTNMEGRIQSFEPVVSPPADAKADWEILNLLAQRMGHSEKYASVQRIRAEIRRDVPMYAGLGEGREQAWVRSTSRLRLFSPDGKGEPILFTPLSPTAVEAEEGGYPFKAILGSLRFHLGSGTRTSLSERIVDFGLKGEVEVFPEDATKLNLNQGDKVAISSPHGSISRRVTLNRHMRPGFIFVPMAFQDNSAKELLALTSPGWKVIQVKMEKLDT